jgi:endoglucanase
LRAVQFCYLVRFRSARAFLARLPAHALAATLALGCGGGDGAGAGLDGGSATADAASPLDATRDAAEDAVSDDADGARSDAPSDADALADASLPLPALPLHTTSRWIVDADGHRFKLASVNWYGAESADFVVAGLDIAPLSSIAALVHSLGFNSVRLPWSNELYETNPVVAPARLTANPQLHGEKALEVLDAVIAALAHEGIVVILDNHRSDANWCCDVQHGDGLWYTTAYPETSWLADWTGIVTRYKTQPAVVAADLRNELRPALTATAPSSCAGCSSTCPCTTPVWGGGDTTTDWHAAAERGGNAVLAANRNLLVMVEGLDYSLDLTGVYALPVTLDVADRLVYAPHDYSFSHAAYASCADMATNLGDQWGYILEQGKSYTAPIWLGELGTAHDASDVDAPSGEGFWFQCLLQYMTGADIDWSYWAVNGTEASGYGRTLGAAESYGILDTTWSGSAFVPLTHALEQIEPATQGP